MNAHYNSCFSLMMIKRGSFFESARRMSSLASKLQKIVYSTNFVVEIFIVKEKLGKYMFYFLMVLSGG